MEGDLRIKVRLSSILSPCSKLSAILLDTVSYVLTYFKRLSTIIILFFISKKQTMTWTQIIPWDQHDQVLFNQMMSLVICRTPLSNCWNNKSSIRWWKLPCDFTSTDFYLFWAVLLSDLCMFNFFFKLRITLLFNHEENLQIFRKRK